MLIVPTFEANEFPRMLLMRTGRAQEAKREAAMELKIHLICVAENTLWRQVAI